MWHMLLECNRTVGVVEPLTAFVAYICVLTSPEGIPKRNDSVPDARNDSVPDAQADSGIFVYSRHSKGKKPKLIFFTARILCQTMLRLTHFPIRQPRGHSRKSFPVS